MRDEIARLAERAAEMLDMFEQALVQYAPISDIERWPYHPEITDTAEQLRALARTDHVEDKLWMVPEGWRIQLTGDSLGTIGINAPETRPGESQRVSGMVGPWCEDDFGVLMFKYFSHVLAASPAPDHSAGVGGMVVDDAIVERVSAAIYDLMPYDRCPTCTAHLPVGKTCGGKDCGLRGKE